MMMSRRLWKTESLQSCAELSQCQWYITDSQWWWVPQQPTRHRETSSIFSVFMPAPDHTDRRRHNLLNLSVLLSVTKITNTTFWKRITDFVTRWHTMGNGMITFVDPKVKGRGHTRPKMDLKAWRRYRFHPLWSSMLSSLRLLLLLYDLIHALVLLREHVLL